MSTKQSLSNALVREALETLIAKVGRDETLRLLVLAGFSPAVADKLCGRRYDSNLREDYANAFRKLMSNKGIRLREEVAS